jgi:HEAT repeat protein
MSLIENRKNELRKFEFPQRILTLLFRLIDVRNYKVHIKAKENFIREGEKILPVMHKLLKSNYKITRKEAMKIVELIAHKSSVPVAIDMLEDRESEIRWIAAETLIRIGRYSIKPLLEALVAHGMSYYVRKGAHHVLSELVNEKDPKGLKQLVHIIGLESEAPEIIPLKAAKILDRGKL